MVSYWIYKYEVVDRNVGVVDYEILDKIEDDLPALAMCFMNPFLNNKLQSIDPTINSSIYLKYIQGEYYDFQLAGIDYDNVTLNLNDYFLFAEVKLRNDSNHIKKRLYPTHEIIFDGMYYGKFSKCYAAKLIKDELSNIEQIIFYYNNSQLLKDWYGQMYRLRHRIDTTVFYPGQFLLEITSHQFEEISVTRNWKTQWNIKAIEYLKRRNSRNHKCMKNWKHFDDVARSEHVTRIGCKVPYDRSHEAIKRCANKKDIKQATMNYSDIWKKYFPKACHRISKIDIEKTVIRNSMRTLQFDIKYPEEVKTITQSKEVDGHSLVGNIGGYIGLFLGSNRFNINVQLR